MLPPNGFVQTQTVPATLFQPKFRPMQPKQEGRKAQSQQHFQWLHGLSLSCDQPPAHRQSNLQYAKKQTVAQSLQQSNVDLRINKCMRFVRRRDCKRVVSPSAAVGGDALSATLNIDCHVLPLETTGTRYHYFRAAS